MKRLDYKLFRVLSSPFGGIKGGFLLSPLGESEGAGGFL
jgi:hypothetical protein